MMLLELFLSICAVKPGSSDPGYVKAASISAALANRIRIGSQ